MRREEDFKIVDEWFADHEATLFDLEAKAADGGETVTHRECVIVWRKQGTTINYVRYHIMFNTLVVVGDLGDAVYQWGERVTLAFLAGCHYDYFASKCQASEYGRSYKGWDEDKALRILREYVDEHLTERDAKRSTGAGLNPGPSRDAWILRKQLDEDRVYAKTQFDWTIWMNENGYDTFGDSYAEYGDIGLQVSIRCIAHLRGLQLAAKQLGVEP